LTYQGDKHLSWNGLDNAQRVVAGCSLFGGGAASAAPLPAPRLLPAPWMGPQWRGPSGAAVVPVVVLAALRAPSGTPAASVCWCACCCARGRHRRLALLSLGRLPPAPTCSRGLAGDPLAQAARAGRLRRPRAADALGRRIAKTVQNRTTLYLPAGAQTVVELERTAMPTQAQIDGSETDGTLANAALTPASGGILPGTATRISFQSATTVAPAGFLRDTGKPSAVRTNGLTYGWSTDVTDQAVTRHGAVELTEFDTFVQAQPDAGGSSTWSIALPNGSYPVIVVAGDALSTDQTNHLVIGTTTVTDATPAAAPAYEAGNFDGYAVQATVTNGLLSIAPATGAFHAKLCFVEIGQVGATISQATIDRLAALIAQANAQTGASPEPVERMKEFVYGGYVDEVVAYQQTVNGVSTRYYPHYNHLYSVAALTNSSGAVVERYSYDAYGKQTITAPVGGGVRAKSAVGWDRGFTGYIADNETGLLHARARQYSPTLGRFVGRDPIGYKGGGYGIYCAYFVPNQKDPSGMAPFGDLVGTICMEVGQVLCGDWSNWETMVTPCRVVGKCCEKVVYDIGYSDVRLTRRRPCLVCGDDFLWSWADPEEVVVGPGPLCPKTTVTFGQCVFEIPLPIGGF
jgi:RHS repeat-associated protein